MSNGHSIDSETGYTDLVASPSIASIISTQIPPEGGSNSHPFSLSSSPQPTLPQKVLITSDTIIPNRRLVTESTMGPEASEVEENIQHSFEASPPMNRLASVLEVSGQSSLDSEPPPLPLPPPPPQSTAIEHSEPSNSTPSMHNSRESTSASNSGASFQQLQRIELLESELERIKIERDTLLAENERLSMQLQMVMSTNVVTKQQQRQLDTTLHPQCCAPPHHSCSCLVVSSSSTPSASALPNCSDNSQQHPYCDCSACLSATTVHETEAGGQQQQQHPVNGGQDLSYTCPHHDSPEALHASSKSACSFSSFKATVVDNLDDFAAVPQHHHYHCEQTQASPIHCTGHHHHHHHTPSDPLTPPSSLGSAKGSTSFASRAGPYKGVLMRTSAIVDSTGSGAGGPAPPVTSSTPTLSPSLSKQSIGLSASLNLSPTSATGSPVYSGYHHAHNHPHSNLMRTVRAAGGSSTSLTSTTNGTTYGQYELSQQLLDKHVTALERKYGGREAREAAIRIQRAYRSYRLQKRFTTLAIQAICHQQLKQQKEQEAAAASAKAQKQLQAQQQPLTVEESVFVEVPRLTMPKLSDNLKVDSMTSLTPIDREAMQHRFSRKMSANYALDDLVRMQSLQHQASGTSAHHHHGPPSQYLSIPRQASPPVTLVTTYEPVYNLPPMSAGLYNSSHSLVTGQHQHQHQHTVLVHHHHQPEMPPSSSSLQKKTSFSSTSSTGSSSSLHAPSSTSSKPHSDVASSSASRAGGPVSPLKDYERRLSTRQPTALLGGNTKQRLQTKQQQQQHQAPVIMHPPPANGSAISGSAVSIHKTTAMAHLTATNGSGTGAAHANTVSFAPNVDFVASNTEAVTSSVDAYRKRQYRVGLNLFNKNPSERGIRFLINSGYIEQSDNAEAQAGFVAHFLLTRKGLSRQMIGEYISEPATFNRQVLKAFCSGVNLSGIIVDEALRAFQVHFRFPGEAQKIERLVEAFADRYKDCNPSDVLSRDSIFILAFAIIMLNTDLHKPTNIKHRMTPEQWLANLKGVFSEGDLSSQFLLGIYKRIKKQELQTGGDHVTQVLKVQSTIIGKDVPNLCVPHRRLVCYCRLYEIRDLNRREKVGQHQRDVFLFNDLLLITKTTSRSRNGQLAEYQYRSSSPLDGLQVLVFSTPYYPNGIRISRRVDNKMIACFNARNDLDQQRFVDDLQEAINEMDDMEQLRITKSSSLVQLNTLSVKGTGDTSGGGAQGIGPGGGGGGLQQSSTVIASPTELGTSFSSLTSTNFPGTTGSGSGSSNGVASSQSRGASMTGYPGYSAK